MGLFDGLIGGLVGAEMATVVNGLIQKHGGIQGIVDQFEKQGLGATVQSWIGNGPNQPITAEQIHQALGAGGLKDLAAKAGLSTQDLAAKLSAILPQVIDKMTPDGKVPWSDIASRELEVRLTTAATRNEIVERFLRCTPLTGAAAFFAEHAVGLPRQRRPFTGCRLQFNSA